MCLQCRRPGLDPWIGEDLLEEGVAAHSTVLAWRIPVNRERSLMGYNSWGCGELDMTE